MATGQQKAKKRATSPTRDKLVGKRKRGEPKSGNPKSVITGLRSELREALEQQTAAAQVLQVINASRGNLEPIFGIILEKAIDLCGAKFGVLFLHDGKVFTVEAARNVPPAFEETVRGQAFAPGTNPVLHHLQEHKAPFQVKDVFDEAYVARDPLRVAAIELAGVRSLVAVPLLRGTELIGFVGIYRDKPGGFTDSQIALVTAFADQAVIAIENARLITEQREALNQQTATAEVLQVINSSPGNLGPVFDATLESATRLCDAAFAILWLCDGERFHAAALHGVPERYAEIARVRSLPSPNNPLGRMLRGERLITSLDAAADDLYRTGDPIRRALVDLGGARSFIQVALVKDDVLLGSLTVYRQEVRAFSERQIALLQNFAAQAVIAIENARLLTEQRKALERQTATAEVLQVINSSPGNLEPVFEAILEKAIQVCGASFGGLWTFQGDRYVVAALHNVPDAYADFLRGATMIPGPGSAPYRFLHGERSVIQNIDLAEEEIYHAGDPQRRALVDLGGARTALQVPLCKDDTVIGVVTIYRKEVVAFDERQISLLQNFAAQAVIAMENARLINETREALDQQTATAEVLQVINASPGNLEPVFITVLEKALRLCEAAFGVFWTYDGDCFHASALLGVPAAFADFAKQRPHRVGNDNTHARALRGEAVMHIVDAAESEAYRLGDPLRRALVDLGGARTSLGVALRKDDALLGVLILYRKEVRPFSERQISLIESFAGQAVVAMENARLLDQLHQRTDDLARSVDELSATGDVLKTISRSSTDLKAVLDTLLETVARLCRADQTYMFRRHEELHHLVAAYGVLPEGEEYIRTHPFKPGRGTTSGRVALERRTIHIEDVLSDPEYAYLEGQSAAGFRTMLGLPLLREDMLVGVFVLGRTRVEPFSPKEIELAGSFADQAVIAIENARLFEELRDRQAELRVTFDNMGDGVAMFDGDHRLGAWNRNFEQIMALSAEWLARRPGYAEYLELLAERGEFGTENVEAELASRLEDTKQELRLERTRADGTVIEVRRNAVPGGGFVLIYSDITVRRRAEAAVRYARDAAEEALEQQTATAEILKVIANSPNDVQPVFDVVVKAAVRLCGAQDSVVVMRDGSQVVFEAHEGPLGSDRGSRWPLNGENVMGRAIIRGRTIHVADASALGPGEFTGTQQGVIRYGFKAIVAAPLMREGSAIGALLLRKPEVGPFTPQQIDLLETFAAQAVIAIENVRLFTELREALEQQTATADILGVISRSPTDVQPVLEAVTRAALRFCGAPDAIVLLRDGDDNVVVAHEGTLTATLGLRRPLAAGNFSGRAIREGRTLQIADVDTLDPDVHAGVLALARQHKWRASAAAPMMHGGKAIGCVVLRKPEPGLLSPRQIALLETFAAQAVIAIENVRLFTELRESLEQQTASAEILEVISELPTDVEPVLKAVAAAARRFCNAHTAGVILRDGAEMLVAASEGPLDVGANGRRFPLHRGTVMGRSIIDGHSVHVPDMQAVDPNEYPLGRSLSLELGHRATLAAPLMNEGFAIGCILLRKPEPNGFTVRQIELVEAFAAQAVIAIQNVRLFTELRDSLERLKAAQANLIQAEKMASLGQLTAGIAHEIKNPLNFVNNFAGLSGELLDELKEAAGPVLAAMNEDGRAEFAETVELLTGNLRKIAEHGKRADGIVKSMLSHSRGGTGDWQESSINALVEEALNLAYHGARAQDKDFNVTMERDFAPEAKPIEVVPQDVTRVFLNLFGNGFYATRKRHLGGADAGYRPTLRVSTRDLGEAVEVRVRDNGMGIQPEVRAKLFQPFFTTKPTGEGTGLGLSISYDIVTQQHGGTIEVESEPGAFTEFTVRLPRRRRAA